MNKTLRNLALVALAAAPFSAFAEIVGSGTAADPYQIATPEDLTKACTKVFGAPDDVNVIYFVQTADIDMSDIKDYFAVNGTYGGYSKAIVYDGCNHVIANFSPDYVPDGGEQGYYNGSVFGVLSGKVMNLGIVDAKVDMKGNDKTAGILGAYFGHGSVIDEEYKTSVVENVYVTGEITCGNYNTGGMFGTTGSNVEMRNCFANVKYTGTGGNMGGIIGRVNASNEMLIENCYIAGTVNETAALVAGGGRGSISIDGLVVFNTGSDKVSGVEMDDDPTIANTSATKSSGVEEVKEWPAFSATEELDGYPALEYVLSGAGTEEDPYKIASAKDLCNAYRYVDGVNGGDYYFVQTADIDMEGIEDYSAIAGNDGKYKAILHYDGKNHLIKNFAPTDNEIGDAENSRYYYCTSIFGVLSGEIKNLGVVNAYVGTVQGAGILGAYAGHSAGSDLTVENVFVQGTVIGEKDYTGGMFGSTGNGVVITNAFANVDVEGGDNTAGLIGRARNDVELNNVYVAGTVTGAAALIVAVPSGNPTIYFDNVVAFNTGADDVCNIEFDGDAEIADADTEADLIAEVSEWDGYTNTLYMGYPMLEGFNVEGSAGFFDTVVGGVEADGPAVYYNLQGVRVANPENGIYIVRRGNKVVKELVK